MRTGRTAGTLAHDSRLRAGLALIACCLAPFTDVKAGPIQLSEIVLALCLLPLLQAFLSTPISVIGRRPHRYIAIFVLMCVASATTAYFRESFRIPSDAGSFLKHPGWISAARLIQVFLVFAIFCVVLRICRESSLVRQRCIDFYLIWATASAVYGVLSFALSPLGIELGGAYGEFGLRLRAFFVEGGPYGLFCGSALLVLACNWATKNSRIYRWRTQIAVILVISLVLAQSKSSLVAIVAVLVVTALIEGPRRLLRYWPLLVGVTVIFSFSVVVGGWEGYIGRTLERKDAVIEAGDLFADDYNVVMGRIAGAIIVPEMIEAHPFLGIGIGNYSLLRDTSTYNKLLPVVDLWDLPGLGLYGFVAEVGILGILPLLLFFIWPIRLAKRNHQGFVRTALSAYPLAALMFGVQPTFLYPWLIAAISLSLSMAESKPKPAQKRRPRRQDDGSTTPTALQPREWA